MSLGKRKRGVGNRDAAIRGASSRSLVQEIRDVKRLEQIVLALVKCELGFIVDRLNLKKHLAVYHQVDRKKFIETDARPEKIVKLFEDLGGTFIKLGQLLSVRPDLLPKEYCDAFMKLQDDVPEFSPEHAIEIIELELKKSIKSMFSHFEKTPVAAASIGQVHEALLKNGRKVAIKVQRPGIKKLIGTDIDILYHLAKLIEKHYMPTIFSPTEIIQEFERYTNYELDYATEAKNIDHFYRNFENDRITKIPMVYWDFTSERVLTMDFIHGTKISELPKGFSKHKKKLIAKRVVNSVFKQVFIDGFFHADPHPGNILVLKNNRIAFLDFGIVGYFNEELKEKVTELFVAMIAGKLDDIAESMIGLGFVNADIDLEMLKRDMVSALERYYDAPLDKIQLSSLFNQIIDLAKKNSMKLPVDLVLLGKAIVTVEGFAVELDPGFNLVKFSRPFVKKFARQKIKPRYLAKKFIKTSISLKDFVERVPQQTTELLQRLREGDKSIKDIDSDIKSLAVEVDKSSNRLALGLLITAFIIASALLFTVEQKMYLGFPVLSVIGFSISFILIIGLIISMVREKRY